MFVFQIRTDWRRKWWWPGLRPGSRKCLQAAAMQVEESKMAKEGGGGGGGLADEMMVVVVEVVDVG